MQFAILILEPAAEFEARKDPAKWGTLMAGYQAYSKALAEAGVMVGGAGLQPPAAATTVRLRDGRRQVQDGPHAETKEQLGGFFLIDVPDLDAALDWAARCPGAATGSVEVRPLLPPPPKM